MNPRDSRRVQPCSKSDAATRLRHACSFLEVAQLVADEGEDLDYASVSAALAVLAGIAASDAACCAALGRRARGQDHREAVALVERIEPSGDNTAASLRRLLSLKDEAHYGLYDIGAARLKAALRQASNLVEFAQNIARQ